MGKRKRTEWVNATDAARGMNLHPATLRRYCASGLLKSHRLGDPGSQIRVDIEDIANLYLGFLVVRGGRMAANRRTTWRARQIECRSRSRASLAT